MNARVVSLSATAADLVSLTKPRLSTLVLLTAAGGMWLAPSELSPARAFLTLLATAGTVAAANALNCYLERETDRHMERTRHRPLPSGRMEPPVALWFGVSLACLSLPALAFGSNLLTAALGLLALLTYVFVYTPLKARSAWAMWVGALPGALPPLMGWTAATGSVDVGGLALFGILFLWQLPHFLAIALFRKAEYAAAGLMSVPVVRGDEASRAQIVAYLVLLIPVTLLPYTIGLAGRLYLIVAGVLGGIFLVQGVYGLARGLGRAWARSLFFVSLVHLSGLFAALWVDGRHL